jgi:hypothetical protein
MFEALVIISLVIGTIGASLGIHSRLSQIWHDRTKALEISFYSPESASSSATVFQLELFITLHNASSKVNRVSRIFLTDGTDEVNAYERGKHGPGEVFEFQRPIDPLDSASFNVLFHISGATLENFRTRAEKLRLAIVDAHDHSRSVGLQFLRRTLAHER